MELSFGQKMDDSGLVMPWLTHGALDEIKSMDLSDKIVWMWGSGLGDCWLAKRCQHLYVVERNQEWLYKSQEICQMNGVSNVTYFHRPCNDSSGMDEIYLEIPKYVKPNVLISDDAYRTEAVRFAIDYFTANGGGILICDNYWQDYVWKSPSAVEWLEPYEKHIHLCDTHTDHEGDPWKTAIIFIHE